MWWAKSQALTPLILYSSNVAPGPPSSRRQNPFGDDFDKPSGSRGAVGASTSSIGKPSASNPAFKWDDDVPPRSAMGAGKLSTGRSLFEDDDDFLSGLAPDSLLKKQDDPAPRSISSGARASATKPLGKSPDDIFGMMRDEPPYIAPDMGLDLFGATARWVAGNASPFRNPKRAPSHYPSTLIHDQG